MATLTHTLIPALCAAIRLIVFRRTPNWQKAKGSDIYMQMFNGNDSSFSIYCVHK